MDNNLYLFRVHFQLYIVVFNFAQRQPFKPLYHQVYRAYFLVYYRMGVTRREHPKVAIPSSILAYLFRNFYLQPQKQEKERKRTTGNRSKINKKTSNLNTVRRFSIAYVIIFRKPSVKEYKCRDSVYNLERSQDHIQRQTRLR